MVPIDSPIPVYLHSMLDRSLLAAASDMGSPFLSSYMRICLLSTLFQNEQSAAPPAIVPRIYFVMGIIFLTVEDTFPEGNVFSTDGAQYSHEGRGFEIITYGRSTGSPRISRNEYSILGLKGQCGRPFVESYGQSGALGALVFYPFIWLA